ncbi:hypothetical protein SDC9_113518 [bioreactor metagenome]|uniref:Uncharacterized protein n=1 Tax=bioreactor metagenome TaxID=1076179 RepID=A0A645BNA2_9ZZZZ
MGLAAVHVRGAERANHCVDSAALIHRIASQSNVRRRIVDGGDAHCFGSSVAIIRAVIYNKADCSARCSGVLRTVCVCDGSQRTLPLEHRRRRTCGCKGQDAGARTITA